MAETATVSAANGRTIHGGVEKVEEPVEASVAASAAAPAAAGTAMEKAVAAPATKAVKEMVRADAKTSSPARGIEEEGRSELEGRLSSQAKSESRNSMTEEAEIVSAETEEIEGKALSGSKGGADEKASICGAAMEEKDGVHAMDIDQTQQNKWEGKADDKKVEQFQEEEQQQVMVVLKKKLGRPKKIRDPEAMKEELRNPMSKTKTRPRQKEPRSQLSERERPSRERKLIDRFVASVERGKKELVIKQGSGTTLIDIPNVCYKLGKKAKGDETLSILHSVLYNKRAKAGAIKNNILQFSGYVWTENEEKERNKVREKLERYTKESLIQIVDVLDLHLSKTGKKEEIVAKVLEFLQAPHKTTDVSLQEKEQKAKEKKQNRKTPGKIRGRKRRKLDESSPIQKRGRRKKSYEDIHGDCGNSDDESLEEEEVERKRLTFMDDHDQEEGDDENDKDFDSKQKSQTRASKSPKGDVEEKIFDQGGSEGHQAAMQSLRRMASSPDAARSSFEPAEKVYTKRSRKKVKENETVPAKRGGKHKSTMDSAPGKTYGRGRRGKEVKLKGQPVKYKTTAEMPSDQLLQDEIRNLLKDLSQEDFSRVTYMDIVVQLEDKFKTDLSVRKGHVKLLIRQELSRLAEEVGEEDEPDPTESEAREGGVNGTETTEKAERQEAQQLAQTAGDAVKFNADAKAAPAAAESPMNPKTEEDQSLGIKVEAAGD